MADTENDGKIKKSDVTVTKNYLSEQEMKQLNRMVTSYLDFAEDMAERKIPLTMEDWEKRLNTFIEMFEHGLLKDAGKASAKSQSFMRKLNLKSTELFKTVYLCLT